MSYLSIKLFYEPSCRGHNDINVFEDIQVKLHQSSPATKILYQYWYKEIQEVAYVLAEASSL